jgi:hypothetical protein
MMSEAELADDNECKEIAEDTVDKCNGDFGKVVALVIARPGRDGVDADTVGKVFVQFEDKQSAIKAAQGLNDVKFDDRVVKTDFSVCPHPFSLSIPFSLPPSIHGISVVHAFHLHSHAAAVTPCCALPSSLSFT